MHYKTTPTIIQAEHHGKKYTIELPWDADVNDIYEAYRGLMFMMGFSIESINDILPLE